MRWMLCLTLLSAECSAQDWSLIWGVDCWGYDRLDVQFVGNGRGFMTGCYEPLQETFDNGFTWYPYGNWPFEDQPRDVVFYDDQRGIAVIDDHEYALTFDGGSVWGLHTTDVPLGFPMYLNSRWLLTTKEVALGGFGGDFYISVSLDSGRTWHVQYHDFDPNSGDFFESFCYSPDGTLYATSFELGLVKSFDLGSSWTPITGLPSRHSYTLACPSSGVLLVSGEYGGASDSAVYISRSEDGGDTWETVWSDSGLHYFLDHAVFVDSLTGWVAGYRGVILSTTDGGLTWQQFTAPVSPSSFPIAVDFVSPTEGWILYDSGIWHSGFFLQSLFAFRDAQSDVITRTEIVPQTISLSTYPNPFNSTLNITYDLPQTSDVTLSVYNTLGQHVETLLNGRDLAGSHSVSWSPNTASGVYLVRLQSGGFVTSSKVLYIR